MPPERSDAAAIVDMFKAAQTACRFLAGKTWEEYDRTQRRWWALWLM